MSGTPNALIKKLPHKLTTSPSSLTAHAAEKKGLSWQFDKKLFPHFFFLKYLLCKTTSTTLKTVTYKRTINDLLIWGGKI